MKILAVIPARGGSKGIPRKNLRLLGGKPLLYYSINNILNSKYDIDVYVSSDDDEIINLAEKFGANSHKRNVNISGDEITLDPVIYDCYNYAQLHQKTQYTLIITIQPTSPLLSIKSLDLAIEKIINQPEIDTIISAKDATHLSWRFEDGKYVPNYVKRVNRQYLTPEYTETGGFIITRDSVITESNRIGRNTELQILKGGEEIDIDTYEDWCLCEYYLKRKCILFVVTGNSISGLGHVYNTLLVANDILNHEVVFLVDSDSEMAYNVIKSKNYSVLMQSNENIVDDIKKISPYIVINDKLDTNELYMIELKNQNYKIINFEDLGGGSKYADFLINAIYAEKNNSDNQYFGQRYFILRDEFIFSKEKIVKPEVKNILITFGGVDPNNFTEKIISEIYDYCVENAITITVIAGYGFMKYDTISKFSNIVVKKNVSNISDFMLKADLIFTSAGRTIYEIASIGTPSIVLAQNERELTHFFASSKYGFLNLGLGYNLSNSKLKTEFLRLVNSYDSRKEMSNLMKLQNLKKGRKRVNKLVQKLIQ